MSLTVRRSGSRGTGRADDDRGAVAIVVAVFMVASLGLAAIVVDLGYARDRVRVAQNAADAAALAAAQVLSTAADPLHPTTGEQNAAIAAAQAYAHANGWPNGVTLTFDLAHYVTSASAAAESEPSFFAGAFGARSVTIGAAAGARWAQPSSGPCSVCVFGSADLQNGDLTIENGDMHVHGTISVGPTGHLIDHAGHFYAGSTAPPGGTVDPLPLLRQVGPVADPFAAIPDPPKLGTAVSGSPKGACTPGVYAAVDGCTSFATGIYIVTAASTFTGNSGATGTGVLFYLACNHGGKAAHCHAGEAGGSLSTNGGPKLALAFTPLADPTYAGLVVYGDRDNTATLDIQGGSDVSLGAGSLYMRSGTLAHGGNPTIHIGGTMAVGMYSSNGNPNPAFVTGTGISSVPVPVGGGIGLVS